MTTPAVQERPATQTTSEAEPTNASEGNLPTQESTAVSEPVQPNSEQETTEQSSEVVAPPDPRQARVQALADAERDEIRQQTRDEVVAELTGTSSVQQKEAQKQKVRSTFTTELSNIDTVFNRAVDEYGSPRALTPAEAGQVKAAFNNYHKVAQEVAEDSVADTVREVAYGMLPTQTAKDTFTGLTSGDVDLPTYLNNWAETAALHTKAVKSMDLEAAVKASPKIKREVEAANLASYDEGRDQGRLDPAGTSPDAGRGGQRSTPGTKSFIQLEEGYGKGELTKAEEAQYIQMREARKRS